MDSTYSRAASVRVEPGIVRDEGYDVIVEEGALRRLGEVAADVARAAAYAVIADAHVAERYGDVACSTLVGAGPAVLFPFPAGEANKTRATWAALTDALLDARIGRDGCIVALGGGVTGDLAGFVAATYMRGLPWIQVPTSLLAMIDASVGGKTGVDVPGGKNLVGAFTPPRVVVADPDVLRTLPAEEIRGGLAEAVKHGVIADPAYLDWIEANAATLQRADDPAVTRHLVRRSVEIKARIVSADPLERGERATLNFGHTIAHAIERVTGYAIPHGRAVAMGMVAEARAGERAGVTAPGTARRIAAVLERLGLPTGLPADVEVGDLLNAAASDKKVRAARVRWALVAAVGAPARGPAGEWTIEIPAEVVRRALES